MKLVGFCKTNDKKFVLNRKIKEILPKKKNYNNKKT